MFVSERKTNIYGPERRTIVCPKCHCTISYDQNDIEYYEDGNGFCCPDCKNQIYMEKYDKTQFPEAFYHFNSVDGYTLSDKETQYYVNKVANCLKSAKVGEYCRSGTGDTMVFGCKYEDEDNIVVCKDYYELSYNFR